ncbi:signal recognition particle receptor beta subunit, putative [Babesia ovata]|uniref:Signal recognition particle receptor subunit beta n=1 Tax=Babesia ovata TaxID=189622 RepID=A0A2H6KI59_9APIC|nr:signal recognition particle receptor beta subunit, putative [Babesia ovata]GBE62682.1 signal recognition particle receptor beta subunit, putative [Babesia ovata]
MMEDFLKIVVLIALFVCPALWLMSAFRASKTGPTVVMCGPSDAGKTALMVYLARGKHVESQTSQAVNTISLTTKRGAVTVIDTPGNFRLLPEAMKYIERATSLIFVVDSADKHSFKMAAQQLVDILLNAKVAANDPSLLFVANKTDVLGSRDPETVLHFVQLEAERILKAYKSEAHMKNIPPDSMHILNRLSQENFSIYNTTLQVALCGVSVKAGDVTDVLSFVEKH